METDFSKNNDLQEKIRLGLKLTFEKLLVKKKKEDGWFAFSENGKVVKVRAVDINR